MNKTILTLGALILASTSLSAICPTCPRGSSGYQQRGYYQPGPQQSYYQPQGRQYRRAQPQRYGQRQFRQDGQFQRQAYRQDGQFQRRGRPMAGQFQRNGQMNEQYLSESDRELLMDIQATLRDNNFDLQNNDVTFFVDNGKVTVTGIVISEEEKWILSDHIASVEGVEDVVMDVTEDDQDQQYQRHNDYDHKNGYDHKKQDKRGMRDTWQNNQRQGAQQYRDSNLDQRFSDRRDMHQERNGYADRRDMHQERNGYADRSGMQHERNGYAGRDQRHGEHVSDSQLENRIRETLTGRWFAKSYPNVRISVNNGNVTLTGQVESESDLVDVENRTKEISGVKQIKNQLQVQRARGARDTQSPQSNGRRL